MYKLCLFWGKTRLVELLGAVRYILTTRQQVAMPISLHLLQQHKSKFLVNVYMQHNTGEVNVFVRTCYTKGFLTAPSLTTDASSCKCMLSATIRHLEIEYILFFYRVMDSRDVVPQAFVFQISQILHTENHWKMKTLNHFIHNIERCS